MDSDKIAYADQASEGVVYVKIRGPSGTIIEVSLDIVDTKSNEICVGLKSIDECKIVHLSRNHEKISNVKVTFVLKYSYFDRLHSGIDEISNEVIEKLLPSIPTDFSIMAHQPESPETWMWSGVKEFVSLDSQDYHRSGPQMFGLKAILRADPCKAPVLIAGSFGTGKTRLLARAAYQILNTNRNTAKVLICAHHQKSVDSFVENYFGKMIENGWICNRMVRLVPKSIAMRLENTKNVPEKYKKYYKMAFEVRRIPNDQIKLVLTTYSSVHQLNYLGKKHFTHILLDEGAQAREPETIIPFCVANKNTTIVIAGDHKQVSLVLKNIMVLYIMHFIYYRSAHLYWFLANKQDTMD